MRGEFENSDYREEKMLNSIDDLLAALNILRIITTASEFESWLKNYHNKSVETFAEGYKFFIDTAVRLIINSIELDYSLGLEEDITFSRASFKGVPIEDIPNTSEKTVVIKNIWLLSKHVRKAKNWDEIKTSIRSLNPLIRLFDELYKYAKPTIEIDKDLALNVATKFYTLVYLNDARNGVPFGYELPSTIRLNLSDKYLQIVFKGYVFALQYLWFRLLGENNFKSSCVRNLHEVTNTNLESRGEDFGEVSGEWFILDSLFGKINEEIIRPLAKELDLKLGFEPLFVIEPVDKSILQPLLSKKNLQEPDYFKKRTLDDIKKWLDYKLLWYGVEVLSSTGSIFSGVPAFLSILVGLVNLSREKVFVRIFRHPEWENRNRYSYGILIPAVGSLGITDYSGWLIFFNSATDYSGFGGYLYEMAKKYLEEFKETNSIEVEEIEVELNQFKDYLKDRSKSSVFDRIITGANVIDITQLKNDTKMFEEDVKGLLFELMVYKWVQDQKYYEDVKHGKAMNNEEIDVLAKQGNKIYLYECKVNVHKDKIDSTLEQLHRKIIALRKEYPEHSIIPILVTYFQLPTDRREFFEKNGIKVKDEFKNEILRLFSKDRNGLVERIFESNTGL